MPSCTMPRKSSVTSDPTRTKSTAADPLSRRRSVAVRVTGDVQGGVEKAGELRLGDDPQRHDDARRHQRDEDPTWYVTAIVTRSHARPQSGQRSGEHRFLLVVTER